MKNATKIGISIFGIIIIVLGFLAYNHYFQKDAESEETFTSLPPGSKQLTITGSRQATCGCQIPFSSSDCQQVCVGTESNYCKKDCSATSLPAVSWNSGMVGLDSGREIQQIVVEYASYKSDASCTSCAGKTTISSNPVNIVCVINGQEVSIVSKSYANEDISGVYDVPAGCYFIKADAQVLGRVGKCCGSGKGTLSQSGKLVLIPKTYSQKTDTKSIKGAASIGCT